MGGGAARGWGAGWHPGLTAGSASFPGYLETCLCPLGVEGREAALRHLGVGVVADWQGRAWGGQCLVCTALTTQAGLLLSVAFAKTDVVLETPWRARRWKWEEEPDGVEKWGKGIPIAPGSPHPPLQGVNGVGAPPVMNTQPQKTCSISLATEKLGVWEESWGTAGKHLVLVRVTVVPAYASPHQPPTHTLSAQCVL